MTDQARSKRCRRVRRTISTRVLRWKVVPLGLAAVCILGTGCSKRPPADFAPDPGLVRRVREVRVTPAASRVCPGEQIPTAYDAVLDDGALIPFSRTYNKKRPPPLHVMFLRRTSGEATPQQDGDWTTSSDPLVSAVNGFRLNAFMAQNPALNGTARVEPMYDCMPHAFAFEGQPGSEGGSGGNGPDVTVRLALLRSPFYRRLLVAAIEVGEGQLPYVFADMDQIPPADWLNIRSIGGRGGRGVSGVRGTGGADGAAGCPGGPGGAGGAGGQGGPGGRGGRGGRVTVIVPAEEPLLAGLVNSENLGGQGGPGGAGGDGGAGGKGGVAQGSPGQQCVKGADGAAGPKGSAGVEGQRGGRGTGAQIVTVPRAEVFGFRVPPGLAVLIDQASR